MNLIEKILSFLQLFFKLFKDLIITPLLKIFFPPQRKDEITINININTRPSSFRTLSRGNRLRVKFGQLEIRTYESILGDNPSCSRGPPIAIGWKYDPNKIKTVPVDIFENHPSRLDRPQLNEFDLLMDRTERERTLLHLGYTKLEIAAATRQTLRDKKKRRQTTDNLSATFVEEKIEGFKKSIRRHFLLKKGTKAMYKEWKNVDVSQQKAVDDSLPRHSILVLSREDSESTGIFSESSEEISVTDDIAFNSTSKCKLSIRRGKSPGRAKAHRRSSV